IGFWYREHDKKGLADGFFANYSLSGNISYDSPQNSEPGMIRAVLDGQGRLVELQGRHEEAGVANTQIFDGSRLFNVAGRDAAIFRSAPPIRTPPMAIDTRAAWLGTFGEGRAEEVRVEGGLWQGRPVYFSITSTGNPFPFPFFGGTAQ